MIILGRPIFKDFPYFKYERVSDNGTGVITQFFGENLNPLYKQLGLLGHNGVDYRCQDGEPIYAAHDGKITEVFDAANSSPTKGYGVYNTHADGWFTVSWHFKDVSVKVGDTVKKGDLVGHADNTGQSTGTHLHFGLYPYPRDMNNGYGGAVDPMPYFEEFITNTMLVDQNKLIQIYQELLFRAPDAGAQGYIGQDEQFVRSEIGKSRERQWILSIFQSIQNKPQ